MIRFLYILPIALGIVSCGEEEAVRKPQLTKQQLEDLSVQMNTWDANRQQDEIDQYIRQHGWTMQTTKSGVYYMLLEEGNGDTAKTGQIANVSYNVYLLDGTVCYSSEKDGPRDFNIGEDYVESGLHEGILLMRPGDKMRFILPSHLAHGLTGDQDKIPPRSSVVYEVKLHSLR